MRTGRLDHLIRIVAAAHQLWPVDVVGPAPTGPTDRGKRIRAARLELLERAQQELGMSLKEVAAECGIDRPSLSRMKHHPLKGKPTGAQTNPKTTLPPEVEQAIAESTESQEALAKRYGCASSTVWRIRDRARKRQAEAAKLAVEDPRRWL